MARYQIDLYNLSLIHTHTHTHTHKWHQAAMPCEEKQNVAPGSKGKKIYFIVSFSLFAPDAGLLTSPSGKKRAACMVKKKV